MSSNDTSAIDSSSAPTGVDLLSDYFDIYFHSYHPMQTSTLRARYINRNRNAPCTSRKTFAQMMMDVADIYAPENRVLTFPKVSLRSGNEAETAKIQVVDLDGRSLVHGPGMLAAIEKKDEAAIATLVALQTLNGVSINHFTNQDMKSLHISASRVADFYAKRGVNYDDTLLSIARVRTRKDYLGSAKLTIPLDHSMNVILNSIPVDQSITQSALEGVIDNVKKELSGRESSSGYLFNLPRNPLFEGLQICHEFVEAAYGSPLDQRATYSLIPEKLSTELREYAPDPDNISPLARGDANIESSYNTILSSFHQNDPLMGAFHKEAFSARLDLNRTSQVLASFMSPELREDVKQSFETGGSEEVLRHSAARCHSAGADPGPILAKFLEGLDPLQFALERTGVDNSDEGLVRTLLPPVALEKYNQTHPQTVQSKVS